MAETSRASTATIVGVTVVVALVIIVFLIFFWPNIETDDRVDIDIVDPTEQLEAPTQEADPDPAALPESDTTTPSDIDSSQPGS